MLKNYFVLFLRNLSRQRLFSFINLLGLTVSITSTVFIFLYVRHEFSYDRFHKNADRIYRVNQTFIWGENDNNQFASTGPGVAHALKEELPELELITSIHTPGNFIISYTTPSKTVKSFEENKILAGDSNFFKMFNFPLILGNPESALNLAHTLVMTESTAKKYFGDENPIGKLVRLGSLSSESDQQAYEVTGILKDLPDNSYFRFDIMLSMTSFPVVERAHWSWVWTQLETYVLLDEKTPIESTRRKLLLIPRKHAEETLQRAMNTTYDEYVKSGKKWELFLQPLLSVHLPTQVVYNRISNSGDLRVVLALVGAAFFIVLLSCINFMNLSAAQFSKRIKEASIRKILGLGRRGLSIAYYLEALMFCLIALISSIGLVQLLLPEFNLITGKTVSIYWLHDMNLIGVLVGLALAMAFLSGSYPAIFLSTFHPVEGIKGRVKIGSEGKLFRNGLVVFQFAISIILMVCTAIVFQQLQFMSQKDLGFNKENLMILHHVEGLKQAESLADAVLNVPGVMQATLCTSVPPTIWGGDTFTAEGMDGKKFPLNYTQGDEHYISTLGAKLKFGQNFTELTAADGFKVILNESAVKRIGWAMDESVIGRKIEYDDKKIEVIGVVSDFNYWPLGSPIEPFGIFSLGNKLIAQEPHMYIALRIAPQSGEAWAATFGSIQKRWKEYAGDTPFQYDFVDQVFANAFRAQQQFGQALTAIASMAMMIAGLGLLGMIIYALESRTKEIGIRKVSGASVFSILKLISMTYTKLILLAFIIAVPVSYWLMQKWLADFAYRVTPSPWVFAGIGLGTLLVAFLITSYHSIKAATTNPIDVLRDE
jgi:putative ABC transport system permease protein